MYLNPLTLRKTLGLYLEPHGSCLCLLTGQGGGITHIRFTADGTKILAGGRKAELPGQKNLDSQIRA